MTTDASKEFRRASDPGIPPASAMREQSVFRAWLEVLVLGAPLIITQPQLGVAVERVAINRFQRFLGSWSCLSR